MSQRMESLGPTARGDEASSAAHRYQQYVGVLGGPPGGEDELPGSVAAAQPTGVEVAVADEAKPAAETRPVARVPKRTLAIIAAAFVLALPSAYALGYLAAWSANGLANNADIGAVAVFLAVPVLTFLFAYRAPRVTAALWRGFLALGLLLVVVMPLTAPGRLADDGTGPAAGAGVVGPDSTSTADPMAGASSVVGGGEWRYGVSKVERQKSLQWSESGNAAEAQGVWEVVHLHIVNIGNQPFAVDVRDFELRDDSGAVYKADPLSVMYSEYKGLAEPMGTYSPGTAIEVGLVFDVHVEARALSLYLVRAGAAVDLR